MTNPTKRDDTGRSMCRHGDTNPLACKLCHGGSPTKRDLELLHEEWALGLHLELEKKALICESELNIVVNIAKRMHVEALAAERASLPKSIVKALNIAQHYVYEITEGQSEFIVHLEDALKDLEEWQRGGP